MRTNYEERVGEQIEIQRSIVQGTARLCRRNFGAFCKLIWPHKTAERLAAEVGCAVRTAAYEISGEREPSVKSFHLMCGKLLE
jgi:hypothetical protein